MFKVDKMEEELKEGTLLCPCHTQKLEFEQIHGMRLINSKDKNNPYISARCQVNKKTYFRVKTRVAK